MALKKLPNDVQSLLCASAQINSFKRAMEELIYNSLDAGSTSIAIRIHIQESTIQVIDNGHGIAKTDFHLIGQRYMTSKVMDVATLKAAPKNYGYRGEFLANIIAVSQMVKVTSRHESSEDTWTKIFLNGKEKKFTKMTTRPTKGTTVDIKGFLYNLNIQKRGIDPMNELQNIKMFLEQLSLVHNHISLSLRDDSQNEIVFKIHKKRDIFQTLSNLFNIDKKDVQELQVEKNEYKVKGFIGKVDKELDLHWIYVNRQFVHNSSKLHKITNEYFKKCLNIRDQTRIKSKRHIDENELFNQNIPFYIIFITCPYIDYDINYTTKQSIIEFKNWHQMNKMLEKLVKFFIGDVKLKEIKNVEKTVLKTDTRNNKESIDTRDQVKKIIDKILGSNSKKLGVSQLQNGVKGKLVKRKNKKKMKESVNVQRLLFQKETNKNVDDKSPSVSNALPISNHNVQENAIQQVQENADNIDKVKVHKVREIPNHCRKRRKIPKQKKYAIKEIPKLNKKNKDLASPVLQMEQHITSPKIKNNIKKQRQIENKHKIKNNKHDVHYLKNTDSVYKRSKIVAQEAEEFLRNNNIKNVKPIVNYYERKKNPHLLKNKYCAIKEREQRINKVKYIMKKLKTKPYKTTYDLLQTIINSQKLILDTVENNVSEEIDKELYRKRDVPLHLPKLSKRYTTTNRYVYNEYSDVDGKNMNEMSLFRSNIEEQNKAYHYEDNFSEILSVYRENESDKPQSEQRFELTDTYNYYQKYTMQEETSHPITNALSLHTYDSHRCLNNKVFERKETENCCTTKPNIRFITKQSKDNFATSDDLRINFKKPRKLITNRQTKTYDVRRIQNINESLYTIEYSKSSENNYDIASKEVVSMNMDYENVDDYYKNYSKTICDDAFAIIDKAFGNTYTLNSFHVNFATQHSRNETHRRYESSQLFETHSIHDSRNEINDVHNQPKDNISTNKNNTNFVFVSKSQNSTHTRVSEDNNIIIEPLDVCETVLDEIGSGEREFDFTFNENHRRNDSLYNISPNNNDIVNEQENQDNLINFNEAIKENAEDVSHHFNNMVHTTDNQLKDNNIIDKNIQNQELVEKNQPQPINEDVMIEDLTDINIENNLNVEQDCNFEINNFNLKNRPRFVPKGMSQIFENCRTKSACDYTLDKDYYEDSIYNNFVNDVQVNAEIYEPTIQNVEDLATKNVHKFQTKVKKDHASLVFDENSLKTATVLGQVDCKFIAAIMENRPIHPTEASQYLILFDQHAVHERIRLEKNLADYIIDDKWTSVAVDNMILKMSKDEILYLHNYKDKFNQLGLFWTISVDNEVIVHSIPEAILGKNPREVDKVIKAVRNVIIEEINVIKLQKGCMSLYPKSIMDLVFSEACRYAIKFGDQLSKNDCVELLNGLSICKTPFQCAHGRPVMAVIMDIKEDKREYKINMEHFKRFKKIN